MDEKEYDLLMKDLCGRLPYGVKANVSGWDDYRQEEVNIPLRVYSIDTDCYLHFESNDYDVIGIEHCVLFLRPLSSMTKEECKELKKLMNCDYVTDDSLGYTVGGQVDYDDFLVYYEESSKLIDWLNKKMFDYRELIPKGLAIEAPDGMYENESDSMTDNPTQITVGCKIRSKTNPDVILRIVSDDCHGDKFECSNGSVLSLKQIKKHYDLYIEENNGTIIIN